MIQKDELLGSAQFFLNNLYLNKSEERSISCLKGDECGFVYFNTKPIGFGSVEEDKAKIKLTQCKNLINSMKLLYKDYIQNDKDIELRQEFYKVIKELQIYLDDISKLMLDHIKFYGKDQIFLYNNLEFKELSKESKEVMDKFLKN